MSVDPKSSNSRLMLLPYFLKIVSRPIQVDKLYSNGRHVGACDKVSIDTS